MAVQLSSVIISESKLEQIKSAIAQLDNHDKIFNQWGFGEVFEKGTAVSLIFHGIPGTGKTLMAQAIADFLNQKLRIIGTADIETSEPGGAERAIKKIFNIANVRMAQKLGYGSGKIKELYKVDIYNDPHTVKNPMTGEETPISEDEWLSGPPQVLLFDECDSLLVDRNTVGVIMSAQINTLLSELEQFRGIVIFTTNRLGKLDPAVERRISEKIEFEFPDEEQRRAIWRRMIPFKAPISREVDFNKLAEFPLVGGNIKNAVLNAARKAAYKNLSEINLDCFMEAIKKEVEGLLQFLKSQKEDKMSNRVKGIVDGLLENTGDGMGVSIQKQKTSIKTEVPTKTKRVTKNNPAII